MKKKFENGERVIYRKKKVSRSPGMRAKQIKPAPHGDYYTYHVDKFWCVLGRDKDGRIALVTRTGKIVTVDPADVSLRRPNWFERFVFANRFPAPEQVTTKTKLLSGSGPS